MKSEYLLNFSTAPAITQTAFPSSSASMADSLPGSMSESFSVVLHPTSYWRDKFANFFVFSKNFANSTVALNVHSLGSAVSAVYGGWCRNKSIC